MPDGVPVGMVTLTQKELTAILRLLEDGDEQSRASVEKSLAAMGRGALDQLRAAREQLGPDKARGIEELSYWVPRRVLLEHLSALVDAGGDGMDLEAGIWCLARIRDPELVTAPYTQELERLAQTVRDRVGRSQSRLHIFRTFLQVIFDEEGFRGNTEDYYDPDNSFLHMVLERRLGIPISLSVLCLLVAHRLGLPIEGIGLPGHFICRADSGNQAVYFDPFNGGRLLTQQDCSILCRQQGYSEVDEFLIPSANREILARMARNLREIYLWRESLLELSLVEEFLAVLEWKVGSNDLEDLPEDEALGEASDELI